ncbi:MAG: thioredoxin fold domain-containing protein [Bacteroidales bacterium]|nr:thioredoxin fold domain-containing protein [Bacteroidales bacterium]
MKKYLIPILSILLLSACGSSSKDKKENKENEAVQQEVKVEDNSLVKSINYNYFIRNIWNLEKYPDSFAYENKLPCIIDFYADWCGPCKKIAPIMEELALEYEGKVLFYKVNVDTERKLATVFQIRNIPTVFFLPKEGQPMSQVGGLTKEDYVNIINEHLIN